jgi:hypothetical protein
MRANRRVAKRGLPAQPLFACRPCAQAGSGPTSGFTCSPIRVPLYKGAGRKRVKGGTPLPIPAPPRSRSRIAHARKSGVGDPASVDPPLPCPFCAPAHLRAIAWEGGALLPRLRTAHCSRVTIVRMKGEESLPVPVRASVCLLLLRGRGRVRAPIRCAPHSHPPFARKRGRGVFPS